MVLCSLILLRLFLNLLCLVLSLSLCYFALVFLLLLVVCVLLLAPGSVPWTYFMLWPSVLCSSYLGSWPSISSLGHPEIESTDLPGFLFTWSCEGVILLTTLFPSIVLHFVFCLSPCSLLVFPVQMCCGDIWPLVLSPSEGLWEWLLLWYQLAKLLATESVGICLWTELRAGGIAVVIVGHIGVLWRSCHTYRNEKPHTSLTEFPEAVHQNFKVNGHR